MPNHRLTPIALVLTLFAGGCAADEPDSEDVGVWANAGSALGVYTHIHSPIAYVVGEASFADPSCPTVVDDGTTYVVTGGCTASDGQQYVGSLVVTRLDPINSPRDLDLTFTDYGTGEADQDVGQLNGTATLRQLDGALYSYDVDLVHDGFVTTEIDYAGTVAGDYEQPTLWNGSGTITRTGFAPEGTARVSTVDQQIDDTICEGQSASGKTTIEVDDHVLVVTYDGETDCDEEQAAKWSLDGEPQGLVEGITCSVSPTGGNLGAGLWLLALLGIRRRARR